jgi:hypothetical protein
MFFFFLKASTEEPGWHDTFHLKKTCLEEVGSFPAMSGPGYTVATVYGVLILGCASEYLHFLCISTYVLLLLHFCKKNS